MIEVNTDGTMVNGQDDDIRQVFKAMARLTRLHAKRRRTKAEEKEYQRLAKIFGGDEDEKPG